MAIDGGFNLTTAFAYTIISATIVRGLVHTGQLRENRLALATAAIFLTCAIGHGHHGLALIIDDGSGTVQGLRAGSNSWLGAAIDGLSALVGLGYLTLRRSYGILLRSPAMFDLVSQAHYRQLAANLPHTSVYVFDANLKIVLAEGAHLPDSTPSPSSFEGRHISVAVSRGSLTLFEKPWRDALAGISSDFDHLVESTGRTYRNRVRSVLDEKGSVVGGLQLTEDVTRERAVQAQLVRALAFNDAVLSATPDITTITDLVTGETTWSSRSVRQMIGWPIRSAESGPAESGLQTSDGGPDLLALVAPEDQPRLLAANEAVRGLADGESNTVRFRMRGPDREYRWVSRRMTPFGRDSEGSVPKGLSLIREITDVVEAEQRLQHAALHDPLTGLPNRILLMDRVASAIDRSDRDNGEVAVLFCDVDGFKRVNDSAGHAAGDAVLIEVANRLRDSLRKSDSVGRVGGDEFVIVLEPRHSGKQVAPGADKSSRAGDVPSPGDLPAPVQDLREVAGAIAERLRRKVAQPIYYEGTQFVVSLSIGMAVAKQGSVAENVVRDADAAMYLAKHRGKDRLEIFDDDLRVDTAERARVDAALRSALSAGGHGHPQLNVAYQPVLNLLDGQLIGFEALARLTDHNGHPIPPDTFIPIAEESGLISKLGEVILDTALGGLVQWRDEHSAAVPAQIHVNLSARQTQEADMPTVVGRALARHGLRPADLILELTESILLQAGSSALRQLTELHDSGVGIAIDDFGTGYASLSYLATLPVTTVKIDRSFTAAMLTDPTSATIVRAIAALSADMGLRCIVEGIETEQQLVALPAGVFGQGYLLGRPSPLPRNDWKHQENGKHHENWRYRENSDDEMTPHRPAYAMDTEDGPE